MRREKGFTLVELIAVIVVIAIIALLIMPSIISTVNYSKETIHNEQIAELEKSARNWYVRNIGDLNKGEDHCVSVAELIQTGYIDKTQIIDSKTGEDLNGYILVKYIKATDSEEEKYEYEYVTECNIDMSGFRLRLMNTKFNTAGWARTNVDIAAIGGKDTTGYRYCISTSGECEPTIDVNKKDGTIELTTEGEGNYACAYGINKDGSQTSKICMGPYKIDKTKPEISTNGDLTYKSSESNIDIQTGVTVSDNITPQNELKITTSGVLSEGIVGEYTIKYTVTDLAGNEASTTRKITIELDDEESPSITLKVSGKPFNSNKWAKANFNIAVSTNDGAGSGIRSYTYCVSQNSSCTPTTRVNAKSGKITLSDESATIHVCGYATDNNGNESETVCIGPYKLDKTAPELTIPEDSVIPVTQRGTDLNSGVSYYDNLTTNGNLVYKKEGNFSEGILGVYKIKYSVTDQAGNTTSKTRTITVEDIEAPHIAMSTTGKFNDAGWANKDFTVNISANDSTGIGIDKIVYCHSTSGTCTPKTNITANNGSVAVSSESTTNYVCAYAEDLSGNKSETKCVGPYKLDKSAPRVTLAYTSEYITEEATSYTVKKDYDYSDNLTSKTYLDSTFKVSGNITLGIPGIYSIDFSVEDEAGNVGRATRNLTIRDTTIPDIALAVEGNPFDANGWATSNFNVKATTTDPETEINGYTYCVSSTGTCTPSITKTGAIGTITVSSESTTNYVCAYFTDISKNNSETKCIGPYKLDKTGPTITFPASTSVEQKTATFDVWSEVTLSDNLTATASITKTATGSLNFATPDDYTITYTATDAAGNTTTKQRTVTVKPSNYNLTVKSQNTNMGTVSGASTGSYLFGTSITVTATNKTGYTFVGWSDGTKIVSTNKSYTFKMPNKDVSLTATWITNGVITFGTAQINGNTITIPYTYNGNGTVTMTNSNSAYATATLNTSKKTITVNALAMGQVRITLNATKTSTYTATSNYKTITMGNAASSNSTAFQSALTEWGTIGPSTDAVWSGATTNGEYIITESINTANWTGFYFKEKQANGTYTVPKYKNIILDVDITSTNSDDDVLGFMVKFNPEATTDYWSGYLILMDKLGVGGGNLNGIWRANNGPFSAAGIAWNTTPTYHANYAPLDIDPSIQWARNTWQHYKIEAIGNRVTVYRWNTNAEGNYVVSDSAKIFEYVDTSGKAVTYGTYGFWCWSQPDAKFKNLVAVTTFDDNFKITVQ